MTIKQIIEWLQRFPAELETTGSFRQPHSYRGNYEDLGVDASSLVPSTVGAQVELFSSCVGRAFRGYKGGSFVMTLDTDVYAAIEGNEGEPLRTHDLALTLFS